MQWMAWAYALIICIAGSNALGNDIRIIETRRNIPLTDDEPRLMDFYINGGSANGIKTNHVFKIKRKLPLRSSLSNEQNNFIEIPVGEIKIIFLDDRTAIGRIHKYFERDSLPLLEVPGFLIGDLVDLSTSFEYKK